MKALQDFHKRRDNAVTMIARCYRRHFFRLLVSWKVDDTRMKHIKATNIQCFWRTTNACSETKLLRGIVLALRKEEAATSIQTRLRHVAAVAVLCHKQETARFLYLVKEAKGVIIRRWWRLILAKRRAEKLRKSNEQYIKDNIELEMRASTTISSAWRGKQGRDICKETIIVCKIGLQKARKAMKGK